MIEKYVAEVRAFSRFYTVFMGVLNKGFLNSQYSLPETRVLHAIYTKPGIAPSEIIEMLRIDKGYLSRMILALEKKKLLVKEKSVEDGRSVHLHLTPMGRREYEKLENASNREVGKMLQHLSESECRELTKCMAQIKHLLEK
jgi:putative acetyltransferase